MRKKYLLCDFHRWFLIKRAIPGKITKKDYKESMQSSHRSQTNGILD